MLSRLSRPLALDTSPKRIDREGLGESRTGTGQWPDLSRLETENLSGRIIRLAPVVQRPHNFIRWIRRFSGSKKYFTLNVVKGFRTLPN